VWFWRTLAVAVLVGSTATSAGGRGLFLEEPPWHRPALADTTLALELGATAADGDTSAFLLQSALSPVRKGPFRLAFTWEFISLRTASGRTFGFGDPRVYARLRVVGSPGSSTLLAVEGAARIPTAHADLYPYATGSQEIELFGSLGLGAARGVLLGAGHIWSEPPGGIGLTSADVPHAEHAFLALAKRISTWTVRVRGDALWMEHGHSRTQVECSVARWGGVGLRPTFAMGAELGPRAERVADVIGTLRFAMPLR
jgi:hypothetical protein